MSSQKYEHNTSNKTGTSGLSQGARILLRILREEMEMTKGAAVLCATLGQKIKSEWNQYRTGCLKGIVQELTVAGLVTRGKTTETLCLSQMESSTSR